MDAVDEHGRTRTMSKLTTSQMAFVAAVVRCGSVPEAAGAVGVTERTAWRWMSRPEVKAELGQALGDVREHLIEELGGKVHDAVEVLAKIMGDEGEKASVRVAAASAILATAARLTLRQAQGPAEGGVDEVEAWFERVGVRWRAGRG